MEGLKLKFMEGLKLEAQGNIASGPGNHVVDTSAGSARQDVQGLVVLVAERGTIRANHDDAKANQAHKGNYASVETFHHQCFAFAKPSAPAQDRERECDLDHDRYVAGDRSNERVCHDRRIGADRLEHGLAADVIHRDTIFPDRSEYFRVASHEVELGHLEDDKQHTEVMDQNAL